MNKNKCFIIILCVLGLFAIFPTSTSFSNAEKPDYTLEISDIGLSETMTKIIKQDYDLPVPDTVPGYYQNNSDNLFIVGHRKTVFKRLAEIPKSITIWLNNQPKVYSLIKSETLLVENVSMNQLYQHKGVVVMTCAGEEINNKATHRLILYYS